MFFIRLNEATNIQAQINPGLVQQVAREIKESLLSLKYRSKVQEFYKCYQFNLAWITSESSRGELLNCILNASDLGLEF